MPTTNSDAINIAREGDETDCKHAKLFEQNTDMKAKLVGDATAGSTMLGQPEAVERQVIALKRQMANAGATIEKLAR